MVIRIGTRVRLKRSLRNRALRKEQTAKVKARIGDIEGGLRLDGPLDGFTSWNIRDLERAPKRRPA